MEKEESSPKNVLCTTCLCLDRNVQYISNEKVKQYYIDILNEIPLYHVSMGEPKVCWECKALLRRAVSFKEQVKDCYRILQTYTNENLTERLVTDVSRPPRLATCSYSPVTIHPANAQVPLKDEPEDAVKWEERNTGIKEEDDVNNIYLSDVSENSVKVENGASDPVTVGVKKKKKARDKGKRSRRLAMRCTQDKLKSKKRSSKLLSRSNNASAARSRSQPDNVKEENRIEIELKEDFESCQDWNVESAAENTRAENHPAEDGGVEELTSEDEDTLYLTDLERKSGVGNVFMADCTEEPSSLREDESQVGGADAKRRMMSESDKDRRCRKIMRRLERCKDKHPKAKDDGKQKIITIEMSYEEVVAERARDAERGSYARAEYKCDLCLLGFTYEKSFIKHVANKHAPGLGDYCCPLCKTIVASLDSFRSHYRRHMRRYECSVCGKRAMDRNVLSHHYDSSHLGVAKPYTCHVCGKQSSTIDAHRYHRDSHKKRVECQECDKTFSHRAGLMNHKLTVHKVNKGFPCAECEKVFRWKTSLKKHMEKHEQKVPEHESPYCEPCGVSFSSVCSYQRHMKNSLKHVTENELKYICADCNRKFANKTKLRDHIEEKHLLKTYQCSICLKPSKNRVCLDQHIRNVHKGRPKNKICHHCGKGFPTKVQLDSHIRSHSGEKPFMCEFCPSTFSQQSNLYKHNRQVHMSIKAKRYPLCRKRKDRPMESFSLDQQLCPMPPMPPLLHFPHDRGFM